MWGRENAQRYSGCKDAQPLGITTAGHARPHCTCIALCCIRSCEVGRASEGGDFKGLSILKDDACVSLYLHCAPKDALQLCIGKERSVHHVLPQYRSTNSAFHFAFVNCQLDGVICNIRHPTSKHAAPIHDMVASRFEWLDQVVPRMKARLWLYQYQVMVCREARHAPTRHRLRPSAPDL